MQKPEVIFNTYQDMDAESMEQQCVQIAVDENRFVIVIGLLMSDDPDITVVFDDVYLEPRDLFTAEQMRNYISERASGDREANGGLNLARYADEFLKMKMGD